MKSAPHTDPQRDRRSVAYTLRKSVISSGTFPRV